MVGVLVVVEVHVPVASSLKEKRGVVRSVVAALRNTLNVSVAEVGYQDLWQRCELGVAIAAGSEVGGRKVAQQVERIVAREPRVEIVGVRVTVVVPED